MLSQANLIRDCGTTGDLKAATHVVGLSSRKPFTLSNTKITEFWKGYNRLVEEKSKDLHFREKVAEDMPIIVRISMRFSLGTDLYDDDFLLELCFSYQEAIRNLLEVKDNSAYICAVLESDDWKDADGKTCRDLELRFPYCRVNSAFQSKTLREKAIEILRQRNALRCLKEQPFDDWTVMIMGDAAGKPVPLVGSVDEKGHNPVAISKFYRELADPEEEHEPVECEAEEVFEPSKHEHYIRGFIKDSAFQGEDSDGSLFWLPYFLSVGYGQPVTLPKQNSANEVKVVAHEGEHETDIAAAMISILSRVEVSDNEWKDMGRSLYNVFEGSNHGLSLWQEYSRKKKPGLASSCSDLYRKFIQETNYLTVRTLGYLAREKAHEAYNEWHISWCEPALKKALNATHTDVAISLYRVYWLDFVCARDHKKWYQFVNHRWHNIGNGLELRQNISSRFVSFFEGMRTRLSQHIYDSQDPKAKDSGEGSVKAINDLIRKLKNTAYKNNLVRESVELFSVYEDFNGILDHNINLLGLRNGVIEIAGGTASFRSGRPEDFVAKSTNIYYSDLSKDKGKEEKEEKIECSKTSSKTPLAQLYDWLHKVFPTKEMFHYFMKFSASCIKGGNDDKIFPIFTGEGNNSKSMIVKLFECTFGSYCIKFPITLLTGKRTGSSNATPELARARAARVAFVDEPGGDETIGNGQLKAGTGGDSFYCRGLHEEGRDVKSTYKLVMQCNNVPIIPHADKATKNRTALFPFTSTWATSGVPKSPEAQMEKRLFELIPNFDQQIPPMASAFLWLMMEYYPVYCKEGLKPPQDVLNATKEYWAESDVYEQFATDNIQQVFIQDKENADLKKVDDAARLSLTDVYAEFKIWYKENFPSIKPPDRSIVKKELISRWGKMCGNNWIGIRIAGAGPVQLGVVRA